MLLRRKFDNRVLFIAGTAIIALRFVLQRVLDRAGVSTDVTDFVMGLLLGVGIGCLILFVGAWVRSAGVMRTGRRPVAEQYDRK